MANYQQIIAAFSQVGLREDSLVNEGEMIRALNNLARQHGINEYETSIAEELWGETPKQSSDRVYVRDFANTILKGQQLVRASISDLEGSVERISNENQRNEKMNDIASYTEDLRYLTVPFGVAAPERSRLLAGDSRYSSPSNLTGNKSRISNNSTVIFAKYIPEKQSGSSTDLKIALLLTIILLCVQIVVMYHKHHFLSILAFLAVFGIYFLGYFDSYYMKFVQILLLASIIFDVVWLIFNANPYWNSYPETQHSTIQPVYLKFILIFIVGLMALKSILIAILFKYRDNTSSITKNVSIFGANFNLNGSPVSPVARIITGTSNTDAAGEIVTYNQY